MERCRAPDIAAVGVSDMPSLREYAALAAMHIKQAQSIEGAGKIEQLRLALSYLRLAEMAQTNARTDIVYETPPPPGQRQPVQQQQQQIQRPPDREK